MRARISAMFLVIASIVGVAVSSTPAHADTNVGSTYLHPSEYTPFHAGALKIGVSDTQFQKTSVGVLSFIYGIAGISSQPAQAPGGGNHTITTSWTPSEIVALDRVQKGILPDDAGRCQMMRIDTR